MLLGIEVGGVKFSAIVTFQRCFDVGNSCHFFIITHQNHPVYLSFFEQFFTAVIGHQSNVANNDT